MESGIYTGTLRHRRLFPAAHEFTYPLFLAYLDIDRLPELLRVSPLTAYNRGNVVSFQESDHFGDPALPLRGRLKADAALRGLTLPDGPIFLLTHLRYFGYNFNPVSFFYCHDQAGKLQMIMAEVNNTFGETQNYWLTERQRKPSGAGLRFVFPKSFHVSPFLREDHQYDWTFTTPGERLLTQCQSLEQGRLIFQSTLKLERRPWAASALHGQLLRFPWVTAKVITAIHWQALRLLWKKVPIVHHPGSGRYQKRNVQNLGGSWSAGS
jgi:DUF1365 family protein